MSKKEFKDSNGDHIIQQDVLSGYVEEMAR